MNLREMIAELERRCPGCFFEVKPGYVHISEYGRGFTVNLEENDLTAREWFEYELEYELARKPADAGLVLKPAEKYRIICPMCGIVVIGYGNYFDQMNQTGQFWYCPQCGRRATFDDENYESYLHQEVDE